MGVGFRSRIYNSSFVLVRVIPPLKNSGEFYQLNVWCINSLNKEEILSTNKEWIQHDNGGKKTTIFFNSNKSLTSSQKKVFGLCCQKNFKSE